MHPMLPLPLTYLLMQQFLLVGGTRTALQLRSMTAIERPWGEQHRCLPLTAPRLPLRSIFSLPGPVGWEGLWAVSLVVCSVYLAVCWVYLVVLLPLSQLELLLMVVASVVSVPSAPPSASPPLI